MNRTSHKRRVPAVTKRAGRAPVDKTLLAVVDAVVVNAPVAATILITTDGKDDADGFTIRVRYSAPDVVAQEILGLHQSGQTVLAFTGGKRKSTNRSKK